MMNASISRMAAYTRTAMPERTMWPIKRIIAGAALLKPRLLICDEPTSSLDTVTTVSILALLKDLCHKLHMTILFISHDLSAVRGFCDRVMVMKDGKILEMGDKEEVFNNPRDAYTRELLAES